MAAGRRERPTDSGVLGNLFRNLSLAAWHFEHRTSVGSIGVVPFDFGRINLIYIDGAYAVQSAAVNRTPRHHNVSCSSWLVDGKESTR